MMVMNKNNKEVSVDTKRFAEILKTKTIAENVLTGESVSIQSSFTVKGKTTTVFSIK